jgi:hypothetical protein
MIFVNIESVNIFMKRKGKEKKVKIECKIDSDFVLNLYEKAKTLKGEERSKLMEQVYFFSEHMGEYLVSNTAQGCK